ncbi:FAD/NAD(P)hypothetical proteinbinding domainhypothetical proteincontaining protein [Bipolaris maydis]|nr:FAD/NAD(P)hypothetical proteinbinding domainhypothetical proteincontaining protein [Bipolaris maydis]
MPGHLGHLQDVRHFADATDVRTDSNEDIRMDGFHYLLSLWSTQIAIKRGFNLAKRPLNLRDEHIQDAPHSSRPLKQTKDTTSAIVLTIPDTKKDKEKADKEIEEINARKAVQYKERTFTRALTYDKAQRRIVRLQDSDMEYFRPDPEIDRAWRELLHTETTLRRRRASRPAQRDCQPNSKKLTKLEEEVIVDHILDLDLRGFSPTYAAPDVLTATIRGLLPSYTSA